MPPGNSRRRTGKPNRVAAIAEPNESPEVGLDWRWLIFLLATVIYLVAFYNVPILKESGGDGIRRLTLQYLMLLEPDAFPDMWLGGDVSRFGLLDRLPVLAVAALIVASATSVGWMLMRAIRADAGLTRIENIFFAAGVGLNLWSLLTLAIGLCGWLHQTGLFVTLMLASFVGAAWMLFRDRRTARISSTGFPVGEESAANPLPRWYSRFGGWIAAPFVAFILLGSMMPPWHFDVREYHLQVPKEWYQQRYVDFLPHNIYGNMPLGAEMHAVLGMALMPGKLDWWYGAIVGKTVIAAFALLTAVGLYAAGRRLVSHEGGLIAAIVFISMPWIAHLSYTGLIEGASAYYLFAAFYAVLLWSRNRPHAAADDSPTSSDKPRLLLAGFLAGGAVACKYPGLLFVVVPLGVWVLLDRRRLNARAGLIFAFAIVVGCGLWFGKNWALAGNPTYPLLYRMFDGRTMTPEKHEQWTTAHAVPRDPSYPSDTWFARHTPGQFMNGIMRILYAEDWVSPLMVPLAAAGLLTVWNRRWCWQTCGLIVFYYLAWWLFTHRLDRFWAPMLPLFALLAAASVRWLPTRTWGATVVAVCMLALAYNLPFVTSRALGDNRFLVALEDLRQDLPREIDPTPVHIHPAHRWLNEHVPPGHRALLVGEAQPFDLEVPVLYNTCFDECILERLIRGRTREERLQAFRDAKISHVFVHWLEIERYRSPGNYGFTDYITKELIRDELVKEQGLLRPVPLPDLRPDAGEIFEVVDPAERKNALSRSRGFELSSPADADRTGVLTFHEEKADDRRAKISSGGWTTLPVVPGGRFQAIAPLARRAFAQSGVDSAELLAVPMWLGDFASDSAGRRVAGRRKLVG